MTNYFRVNPAASGPVRLFTPYKRRRKAQQDSQENANSSGNGQQQVTAANVTITTPVVTTNNNNANSTLSNNTNIISNSTSTQQLHIQTTPIQNNNNNNTVTFNANNGIKKKRYNLNIINVKPSESSEDIESENITFTPAVTAQPAVKEEEEAVTPWQTVTEAIQEIPSDYVDQTRKSR